MPTSAIFLSDTDKQILTKVRRHAFSGGRDTAEQQRESGADITVDVSYHYLQIFGKLNAGRSCAPFGRLKDYVQPDFNLDKLINDYAHGIILTDEFKLVLVRILTTMLKTYRDNRVPTDILQKVMSLRPLL